MSKLSLRKAVRLVYEIGCAVFRAFFSEASEADEPAPKSRTSKKAKRKKRLPAKKAG